MSRRAEVMSREKGVAMKDFILGSILTLFLLASSAVLYGQTSDLQSDRLTNPTSPSDTKGRSNAHNGSRTLQVPGALPESHIPPRSPDLGSPTFPLSPSIGPRSGLLGPESGPGPARLRSGDESQNMRGHLDRPAR